MERLERSSRVGEKMEKRKAKGKEKEKKLMKRRKGLNVGVDAGFRD